MNALHRHTVALQLALRYSETMATDIPEASGLAPWSNLEVKQ